MSHRRPRSCPLPLLALLCCVLRVPWPASAAEPPPAAGAAPAAAATTPVSLRPPSLAPHDRPLPINLPTALKLAQVQPLDIAAASARLQAAAAQLERARVLWLPDLYLGADYYRHDGRIINDAGQIFDSTKTSVMAGAGPVAVFALSEAIFSPLAQRQVEQAREAAVQTARNDSLLNVAEAYFNVQQARGELAGAEAVVRQAQELVRRTSKLAPGIVPPVETVRARTELARRRQVVAAARESWRVASAELVRILRLQTGTVVEPLEPPHLAVTLIGHDRGQDELIELGLLTRPELAGQRALVQAAIQQLRLEHWRPLLPSVLLRGTSTSPAGILAGGVFGGGEDLNHFGARGDFDVELLWQFQNLGFGNLADIKARRAEKELAVVELFRIQDQVAADVSQAYAQVQSAAERTQEAEAEVKDAVDSLAKNFQGLGQTKRAENLVLLVIRPQEVDAAIQALGQAYADYYGAVGDYNRAQFRLYRALGRPAQAILAEPACRPAPAWSLGAPQPEAEAQPPSSDNAPKR